MKGKLIKENNGYTLFVDGKVFGDTDGHQLKSITNRLSIKNCQIIELDCDLDELIKKEIANGKLHPNDGAKKEGIERGIQIALEILGDKKFSEEDVILIAEYIRVASQSTPSVRTKDLIDEYQSLQKTEWDVEVEMVKEHIGSGCYKKYPKLDDEGCLILKKYKNG